MGSVDRYTDFTRSLYPLQDSDKRRWTNIEVRAYDQIGLPPIEVYQIGEAYFVLDGNHRVSVAREMEATHIEAYVTKVQTRLALSPEADRESPAVQLIKAEFNQRCVKAGIPGKLAVEAGPVAQTICTRASWADLVVIRVIYPPASQPMARLGSGLRTIIRQCRCPLLIVPRSFVYPLDRALLAFDGSPKAEEALYMATYLASQWGISLVVVTVTNGAVTPEILARAQNYLHNCDVEATYVGKTGGVAEAILQTAEEHNTNLIIMGGYGYNPVLELVLGSAVDEVLRKSKRPMLICG